MEFLKKYFVTLRGDILAFFVSSKKSSASIEKKIELLTEAVKNDKQKAPEVTVKVEVPKLPDINIPEIKIPDVHIPEIKVPDIKFPDIIFPKFPEIKIPKADAPIVNIPEIKIPKTDVKFPDEMKVKGLKEYFQNIIEVLKKLKPYSIFAEVDHNSPVPVILVDRKGSSYKAGGGTVFAGGGAQGGPSGGATEEKQDDIISAIGNSAFSSIGDGRKTVTTAGTAEALAGSTACKEVVITAMITNTGNVVVGGSTVVALEATRRGVALMAGSSLSIKIDNLSKIYIDSEVNGEGITYLYYN